MPKLQLIGGVQALLHEGRLQIKQSLPDAETLVKELRDFRIRYSNSGHLSFGAREGKHDDLVLALAIAVWKATKPVTGAESWIEYLRRQNARAGTDRDDIQAPDPSWGFGFGGSGR